MGCVTDLPDMVSNLKDGHRTLVRLWNELFRLANAAGNGIEINERNAMDLLKELQRETIVFLQCAEGQVALEERQLVPELEAYFEPEDTAPSIHFSTLVLDDLYRKAKRYGNDFIRQVDALKEPVSVKRAGLLIAQLREGLQMAANYLNAEHLLLPPADRMLTDLESWYL